MSDEFVVEPDVPLALHSRGGQLRMSPDVLASVVLFLGRSGYAVWAVEDGETVVLRYWRPTFPNPRPWWKLWRRR